MTLDFRLKTQDSAAASRRRFIKTGLIFVPSVLATPLRAATTIVTGRSSRSFPLGDGGGGGGNAEVNDWVSRVQGRGSDVSEGTKGYVNTFVTDLKDAGIFTKIKRMNVYAGDSLAALEAPLVKTWGATTDSLTNFDGGDYSESTGLAGNGTDESIDMGFTPSSGGANANDWHMAAYNRTATDEAKVVMGGQNDADSTASTYLLISYGGTSYFSAWDVSEQISASDSNGVGFYVGTRRASNDIALYKNGSSIASSSTTAGTLATATMRAHAWTTLGATDHTTRRLSFYSIGTKLTAGEISDFYDAVQALQTSLGRDV